jgi:hypothetical protein
MEDVISPISTLMLTNIFEKTKIILIISSKNAHQKKLLGILNQTE